MNTVNIILPVYNGESTLQNAIESVIKQTYSDYSLIIVDDGSTDSSGKIADEYAEKYDNIYCLHKKNGGQSSARNTGLNTCKEAKYICFLDADDTLQPNALQRCVDSMQGCNADFVLFGFNVYSGIGGDNLLRTPNPGDFYYKAGDSFSRFHPILRLMASPCNKMYRREYIKSLFEEHHVYDEDSIFNFNNFTSSTSILCISDCLYNVHLGTVGSVNKRFVVGKLHDMLQSRKIQEKRLKEVFPKEFDVKKHRQREVNTLAYMVYHCLYAMNKKESKDEISKTLSEEYAVDLLKHKKSVPIYYRFILNMCTKGSFDIAYIYAKTLYRLKNIISKMK